MTHQEHLKLYVEAHGNLVEAVKIRLPKSHRDYSKIISFLKKSKIPHRVLSGWNMAIKKDDLIINKLRARKCTVVMNQPELLVLGEGDGMEVEQK